MVVEADESDGTFVKLPIDVALVTNIDPEHLDHYGSFEKVREAFRQFVENVPFYGFAVMCMDHPEVQSLIGRIEDRRIITYGMSPQAAVRAVDLRVENRLTKFGIHIRNRHADIHVIDDLTVSIPGAHNVQNATGAVAIAHHLGVGDDAIRAGLAGFGGVKRRFTHTGSWDGVDVFDDYGHHPVEIAAVLKAARSVAGGGHVVAVVQPHRYTRLRDLFDGFCSCFNDADTVIVAPVYPAGEAPIEGFDRDALVEGLRLRGHRDARALPDRESLAGMVRDVVRPGDTVVCLGAGSISQWAYALPGELAK
jgi:UDP-N-acetylmuramate--alanine ligase